MPNPYATFVPSLDTLRAELTNAISNARNHRNECIDSCESFTPDEDNRYPHVKYPATDKQIALLQNFGAWHHSFDGYGCIMLDKHQASELITAAIAYRRAQANYENEASRKMFAPRTPLLLMRDAEYDAPTPTPAPKFYTDGAAADYNDHYGNEDAGHEAALHGDC